MFKALVANLGLCGGCALIFANYVGLKDVLLDSLKLAVVDNLLNKGRKIVVLVVGALAGMVLETDLFKITAHYGLVGGLRKGMPLLNIGQGAVGAQHNWHLQSRL